MEETTLEFSTLTHVSLFKLSVNNLSHFNIMCQEEMYCKNFIKSNHQIVKTNSEYSSEYLIQFKIIGNRWLKIIEYNQI